ncbi:endonuclease/exonuclease/phosphatase family protein [Nonomuraea zeae]|uniref:Endonuclease/exonuclease/phosphatase domain-containing protein n=1 Tax=Nonomuraea zeae TaxID=1642303 RepID=A0A5S4GBY1_9ACTN|nr:endonuclease/exonuclease/phosphatase family protein [Nonomuraea zeae]TMR30359.1 hypothetical protein ETD85_29345 [Nonomuraea zeae]
MTTPRGPAVLLALGIVVLLDVLRVFLPSLITLFGRAGETPPELMGLYAAAWFVLPFLALFLRPRHALAGGAVALVLARVLLQAGVGQLYVASAGVTAGLVFLYGCAHALPRQAVPVGIMGGLSLSVFTHMLLDGVDVVWRDGVAAWLAAAALCLAFLTLVITAPAPPADADRTPAATWFLFGPVLLLVGVAATAWPKASEGPVPWWQALLGPGLLAISLVVGTSRAIAPARASFADVITGALTVLWSVMMVMPMSANGVLGNPAPAGLLIMFTGALLAGTIRPGHPAARRPGLWLLCGALVFLVGVFAYYASYDLDLGFPNGAIIVVMATLVAGTNVTTTIIRRPAQEQERRRLPWRTLVGAAVLAPLLVVVSSPPIPDVRESPSDTLRLITYNIRMGFGLDGRLSLAEIASWAAAQRPDVVLLSEVDRGWLLNGGHDDLATIARGLGMRYYFAPAADNVWGDALLTNLPVRQVHSHALGRHDYPTGAQAQAIVLEAGGREVGIVNTHLQAPEGQAPEVAAIAADLAAGASAGAAGGHAPAPKQLVRPVILTGDLNLRPGDPPMRVLEAAGLTDPLIALGDPPTSPAGAPVERIDHVLISKGLAAISAQAPRLPYSDHLPVLTTLRLTSVDQEG